MADATAPTATPTPHQTYQDLIAAVEAATAAVAVDTKAQSDAQSRLAADQATLVAATAARDQAVVDVGEAVVVDQGDGLYSIYEDSGAGHVVVKKGIAGTSPLPAPPAGHAA